MVFNWFNKKKKDEEEHIDPTNIQLNQLKKGAFLDYDFKTWEVRAWYEYDWGNNFFTDEFQLNSGNETFYLHVEDDDELELQLVRKINLRELEGEIAKYIIKNDNAPLEVVFEGVKYHKENEAAGYFRNTENDNWEEFITWSYYDTNGGKVLNIERWDEEVFEAAAGIIVKDYQFSNIILP